MFFTTRCLQDTPQMHVVVTPLVDKPIFLVLILNSGDFSLHKRVISTVFSFVLLWDWAIHVGLYAVSPGRKSSE